ncbi:murein biosynthesis integral membrane protein MurJ [Boudabousia marimammalium]|uniref:Murein biosynthesis integral membrane protein MurJ n=1 Tax=Boudabousia marimammalium TaxID=156892 RepID=A0A1Q5PS91_9ACTO|nr:lipid II flippase MurJ [Boudabousia marimammalium]OKL50454.1 hypothetical protein BM477_00295 [Boudabousia marimammalium]
MSESAREAQQPADANSDAAKAKSEQSGTSAAPEKINVVRSSLTIAAGTMTSRALGFIRGALLIAVLGAVGVQDSFQVANTLPQQVYGLLAGSVIAAVLIPEIVRAFDRKDGGRDYVNRLLTLTGTALFVMTLVMTVGAVVLVDITYPALSPQVQQLAYVWAFWFMPQIFFYGMQSVLGQVLNALGHFWEAAWSPVLNNIIAIAGLFFYVWLFGWAPKGYTDPAALTQSQIITIAIPTTLGIVVQAMVLLWPLKTVGFFPKFTWGFRGYGLGRAFRIAAWTMASATIYMLSLLSVQWLASGAEGYGAAQNLIISGPAARANAYAILMLPHSVFTVSIMTAIFPKLAHYASSGAAEKMRGAYDKYIRDIFALSLFFSISLLVFAVPIFQAYAPSRSVAEVFAYAQVLKAYSPGLIFLALFGMQVKVLLSYGLARVSFIGYVAKAGTLVLAALLVWLLVNPLRWVAVGAMAEIVSFIAGSMYMHYRIEKLLPGQNNEKLLRDLIGSLIAAIPTWMVASLVLWLRGEFVKGSPSYVFTYSVLTCVIGGLLSLATYLLMLWAVGNREAVGALASRFQRFLPRR